MTTRRLGSLVIAGLLVLGAVVGVVVFRRGHGGKGAGGLEVAGGKPDAHSPLKIVCDGIRRSDVDSLAALVKNLEEKPEGPARPIGEAEAAEWLDAIAALRAGYLKFNGTNSRAHDVAAAGRIFEKFAVEPAPASWHKALTPLIDILTTGLTDREPDVRAAALTALGKLWAFYPGRTMLPAEEKDLAAWKDGFHSFVLRRLGDDNPKVRAAAVACLGLAPIDSFAAPAVAFIDDPKSGDVRHQVLMSFARRTNLLTEDMIIKRLHDEEAGIPQLAEIILHARGLSKDQIALGRLITSPQPEMRASVIPLLREREDLDHVVWLLRLSHDSDEIVRTKTVEAMVGRTDPELRARLREMASKDTSEAVRAAAGKLVAQLSPAATTAALPPLPGSPSLTPKAN